jgi:hypothetical protein
MPKRLLFAAALFLFSFNYLTSCKTDFDVNAPYKEQYVVYGLLELHNDVQIIKISKIYQNSSGSTAYQGAKQVDSLYQKEDLDVKLIELQNGNPVNSVSLVKYFSTAKDSGLFASPGQYLFATPSGFKLNASATYKLTIDNAKSKVHCEAQTVLVNDVNTERPNTNSVIGFSNSGQYYSVLFNPGANATSYDLNIRIPIAEYRKADSQLVRRDTLNWSIFKNYTEVNGSRINYGIYGKDFYLFMQAFLKVDNSIFRTMDSLDFDFVGAGSDLTNYISVNSPSLGIVQKKPDYTNVSNGIGILSSRLHTHLHAPLSDASFEILQTSDVTAALNFKK